MDRGSSDRIAVAAGADGALRHGTACMWVDLELDLWKALADTIKKWEMLC